MRTRSRLGPVVGALCLLAVAWPIVHAELGLGAAAALAVGLAGCVPVALVRVSPTAAWLLSLATAGLLAVAVRPGPDHPLPVPVVHVIVLLLLLGVLVVVARPVVAAAATVATVAGGLVAAGVRGTGAVAGATVSGVAAVLLVALLVRTVLAYRRRLAAQEEAARRERASRAVLEERTRIAHELHDVVAHSLSTVAVRAETAPYRVAGTRGEVASEFAAIAAAARRSLSDLRGVLGVLRPDDADEPATAPQPGLDDVDRLLEEAAGSGIRLSVSSDGDRDATGPAAAMCLYRVLAEALANASRHAIGAPVEVHLQHGPDAVEVRVVNGAGHDTGPGTGLGLRGLRERAAVLGGELDAGPAAGGGFALHARLPTAAPAVRA